jgi:hypothetical protein
VRLHSAIGYITPEDKLEDRAEAIHKRRQEKLSAAQAHRQQIYAEQTREGVERESDGYERPALRPDTCGTLMLAPCLEWKSCQGGVARYERSSLKTLKRKAYSVT